MKTSLHFEAPVDLSVGTVRILRDGQTIADWVATPDNRVMQADDLKPGLYSAEVHPAGVSPQSVIFEVHEGQANTVILPTFSALSSTGSNTSFFDTDSLQTMAEIPVFFISDESPKTVDFSPDQTAQLSGLAPQQILERQRSQVIVSAKKKAHHDRSFGRKGRPGELRHVQRSSKDGTLSGACRNRDPDGHTA